MNIKIPKRNMMTKTLDVIKVWFKKEIKSVTTKKGQNVRNIVIFIISISLIIALTLVINNIIKSDTFSTPDNTKAKYLNEKNSGKIKETYSTQENRDQFLSLAKAIELKIANYYINTTSSQEKFDIALDKLNEEFKQTEWKTIGMQDPKEWIGEWNVDKTGAVKFKFLNKQMEPEWINDVEVSKYIVKN